MISPVTVGTGEETRSRNWTAFTIDVDGSAGVATDQSRTYAMAAAIAACRLKSRNGGRSCGARTVTVRTGWSLGYACGSTNFVVNAVTYIEAKATADYREAQVRDAAGYELPPCRLIVAVGPNGRPATRRMIREIDPATTDAETGS